MVRIFLKVSISFRVYDRGANLTRQQFCLAERRWQASSTRFFLLGHWIELGINLITLMLILETVSKLLLRATPSRPSLTDGKNFYLSFFFVCKCRCKHACACVSKYMCGCVGVEVRGQSLALFLKLYQSRPHMCLCVCTCVCDMCAHVCV